MIVQYCTNVWLIDYLRLCVSFCRIYALSLWQTFYIFPCWTSLYHSFLASSLATTNTECRRSGFPRQYLEYHRFCGSVFLHTACCIHRALVLEILYSVNSWRISFYAGYTANICFWCWTDEELPFTVLNSIVTARVFISHLLTHFQHRRNPNTASWPWRQHSHACCARTCCHWKVGMLGISVWQELQAAMLPEER